MKKHLLSLLLLFTIFAPNLTYSAYIWQDFDNPVFPPAGWTLSTNGPFNWEWSIRCSAFGYGYGAIKANFNDANSGNAFDIISPLFISAAGDSLVFSHAYATYSGANDQLKIYYSTNGGTNWAELITLNGGSSGPLVTASATGVPFVPTNTQWAVKSYPIPAGTNKIKFTAVSAVGNNLYLDNIKIGSKYALDAGAIGITRFQKAVSQGLVDTPKVYVRNFGSSTQSFPVTLKITPGTYSQTLNANNVASGETQTLIFPVWTVGSDGVYTLKAYTSLNGEQNQSNDTIYNYYISTNNPRNVLIEYCTGTWCQWCPCGKTAILNLEEYFPNTVVLAYHGASTDPWKTFNGNNILTLHGMNAYPTGTPDRLINPNAYISASGFFEYPFMRYLNSPESPVKIDITNLDYNASTRMLNVTLNTTALENLTGQFKINYVITEDNLVYNQTGNTYCPGNSSYVHKWVVRNMVNGATGENLNTGNSWTNGQVISKTFSDSIKTAWIASNCKLKVFVYKDNPTLYLAEVQQAIESSITATSINENGLSIFKYELSQNYPNPFNPYTNIKFSIPKAGFVSLKIYDVNGRLVSTYLEEYINAGLYNADLDGSNLASGIYFYTLTAGDFKETKKMILVK